MWGPDKYQEETPELMAAIEEIQARVKRLLKTTGKSCLVADGIVVMPTYRIDNDVFRIPDGYYIEVFSRRAYTEQSGTSSYADPELIFEKVLPALRHHQVLDDIVDASKEPPSE
jgi:hypothetical protein